MAQFGPEAMVRHDGDCVKSGGLCAPASPLVYLVFERVAALGEGATLESTLLPDFACAVAHRFADLPPEGAR